MTKPTCKCSGAERPACGRARAFQGTGRAMSQLRLWPQLAAPRQVILPPPRGRQVGPLCVWAGDRPGRGPALPGSGSGSGSSVGSASASPGLS